MFYWKKWPFRRSGKRERVGQGEGGSRNRDSYVKWVNFLWVLYFHWTGFEDLSKACVKKSRVLKVWLTAHESDRWAYKQTTPMVDLRSHNIMEVMETFKQKEADHCELNTLGSIFCLSLCFLDPMRQSAPLLHGLQSWCFGLITCSETTEPTNHGLNTLKEWANVNLSWSYIFAVLYQDIKLSITACDFIFSIFYFSALYFNA